MRANEHQHFSYSYLPPEKEKELRGIAARLVPLLNQLRSTGLEAGKELKKAKKILKHGELALFCRDIMKTDVRMCQYFIKIADLAEKIGSEIVEMMPASSAAALSSAPPAIVSEVVEAMKGGEKCPSVRIIKERTRDARTGEGSAATVEHEEERLASVATILMKKLEKEELSAVTNFLNTANKSSIVALCDKIRSDPASG